MMRRRRAALSSSQSPQPESSHPSSSDRTASSFGDFRQNQQHEQHPTKTTTTRLGDADGDDDDSLITTQQQQRVLYPIVQCCTYYTSKWAILRLLAAVYLTAFIGAWYQNEGLMGTHGIVPAEQYWKEHILPRYHQDDNDDNDDFRWRFKGFLDYPSLLIWWIPLSDFTMRYFIIAPGIVISFIVLFWGVNSWLLQLLLWILDFSIVTVASNATSSFYAYGWESQLLESGFLAIFLCNLPVYDWRCKKLRLNLWENKSSNNNDDDEDDDDDDDEDDDEPPPSEIILWLFCWLMFRISLGAGLIKIRGSSCWALKTCLHYHFETQPIPSPLSFLFHFLPKSIQTHMVNVDLWVQLYTSWIVLLPTNNNIIGSSFPWPHGDDSTATAAAATASNTMLITEWILLCCRWLVRLGGWIQAGFMVGIILSGNFGFLNHLTIIPALACLDDECWPLFMNRRRCRRPRSARTTVLSSDSTSNTAATKNDNDTSSSHGVSPPHRHGPRCRQRWIVLDWILFGCIMYLSWPVIANLLQLEGRGRQVMNMSFGSFRLVNTYGAFGDVSRTRYEPIVSIHGGNETDQWIELEFPCKPGSLTRRPCFSAPYHYRLDWNIWFLGFKPHKRYLQQREQWMYSFLKKVLEPPTKNDADDQPWLNLLDRSTAEYLKSVYYSKGTAPRYAKVDMYYYGMAGPLWDILAEIFRTGQAQWWKRAFEEHLILPVEVTHNRLQFALVDSESK